MVLWGLGMSAEQTKLPDVEVTDKIGMLYLLGLQLAIAAMVIFASQTSEWLAAVGVCALVMIADVVPRRP